MRNETYTYTYHMAPGERVSFDGNFYWVEGSAFDSPDEAWEYAAEYGYLWEPVPWETEEDGSNPNLAA